jgi:hypothetical protein
MIPSECRSKGTQLERQTFEEDAEKAITVVVACYVANARCVLGPPAVGFRAKRDGSLRECGRKIRA